MRRLCFHSPCLLQPGPSHRSTSLPHSQFHEGSRPDVGQYRKNAQGLINLPEFMAALLPCRFGSNWRSQRDETCHFYDPERRKCLGPNAAVGHRRSCPTRLLSSPYPLQLYKCAHSSSVMDLCNKTHFPLFFSAYRLLLNNKIIIYWLFKKVHMRGNGFAPQHWTCNK